MGCGGDRRGPARRRRGAAGPARRAAAELDETGISCDGPSRGIPESLYFRDPDGIGIELLSDELMFFAGHRLDEA